MVSSWLLLLTAICTNLDITSAGINDQVEADIEYGTFEDPASLVRPRFRYWLPDASVDPEVLKEDIESSASVGAGGVELLPFFNYGGQVGIITPVGTNWSTYNFGTPAFNALFKVALQTHAQNGLKMDFAIGPNQGQGIPSKIDNESLQWDLVPYMADATSNGSYNGIIPGWGAGELVALVSASVISQTTAVIQVESVITGTTNVSYEKVVLKSGTLVDHTSNVSPGSGMLSLDLTTDWNSTTGHKLFAFYQKLSLNKNLVFNSSRTSNIFDNGSYVVDHYSAAGAQAVINFWEEHILTDEIRALMTAAANYGWEDSVEILSNITWSKGFPERFEKLHSYDMRPYLPLMTFQQNNIGLQTSNPGSFHCILDTDDQGIGFVHDFHKAIEDGYFEYLQTLVNWTNSLGLQFSAQPGYNLPMDMLSTVPHVNAPECESLGFFDNIDIYRQFSGPANLAGKRVISNEIGAELSAAYRYPISTLLTSANRGFVGGVNQYVLHGQSYTGNYYGTTWPGYTAFAYLFSESYSNKQPAWDNGFGDALDYLARLQQTQQKGVPKVDVAVYNKQSASQLMTIYKADDLLIDGWSYTYISPDNFALPEAVVEDRILAPSGPAWKALVIQSSENLTLSALATLGIYASSGLPIIFSGGEPNFYPTGTDIVNSSSEFSSQLSSLLASKNVYSVSSGGVASQLTSLGITPNVRTIVANGTWYTTWRVASKEQTSYALVFADSLAASGKIIVYSTATPYRLDPWTGTKTAVPIYIVENGKTTIPLTLAANETALFAFTNNKDRSAPAPKHHITSASSSIIGVSVTTDGGIEVQVSGSSSKNPRPTVSLSSGEQITVAAPGSIPTSFKLTNWTLTATHWEHPSNISDASIIANKWNSTHTLSSLVSWTSIPALANVSGVGYYSTSFLMPSLPQSSSGYAPQSSFSSSSLGATLTLPRVLHTVRVTLNGHALPPVNLFNPVLDLTPFLHTRQQNELLITVPTTMWNYLRSVLSQIKNAGEPPYIEKLLVLTGTLPGAVDNGLIGDVVVTPFMRVGVA